MTAESTPSLPPHSGATTPAARACFILLAACLPASMLLVLQPPAGVLAYLRHQPDAWRLYEGIAPAYPDWVEYFAVQTLAAAMAVCGAWHLLCGRQRLRLRGPHAFAALVGAYALWAAVSTLWSVWPYGTRAWVIRELPFWFLAIVASLACRTERRRLTLARVLLASVLVQAAVSVVVLTTLAHAHGWSLTRAFLENPLFFQNKNFSCAPMLAAAYVAVALTLRRALSARRPFSAVVGGLAALGLVGSVFVAAGALAGWVALGVSGPAYALCLLPIRRKGLIVAAAAGVVVLGMAGVLAVGSLRQRAVAWALNPRGTANLRVTDWTAGLSAFAGRPLAGWGVGTWPAIFARFAPPMASEMPQTATTRPEHPHNEFVRVACDLGIVGLLLYAGLLAWAFISSYRALRGRPLETRLVGYALWAGALAFLVQTLFGKAPAGWSFSTAYWLLLGVLASSAWSRMEDAPATPRRVPLWGWGVLGAVALGAAAGWWSWGVGGYRSMVELRRTEEANQWLEAHPDEPAGGLDRLQKGLELARPRSLQPAAILYYDYVVGGTLVRLGRWQEGASYLEKHVDRWAPGFLKTDLMLAACYANTGRPDLAAERCERYVRENPYPLEGYVYLARFDPVRAASLLEGQLYKREGLGNADKVMTLLQMEAALGAWDKVRSVVRDASRANNLDPDAVLRLLAEKLDKGGRQTAAEGLKAAFPEAFRPSATTP